MGKKAITNGYIKGLNRDINKHELQNQNMFWNQNFRLITQEGQSNGILENVIGNSLMYDEYGEFLQVEENETIIGHYVFTNKDIILFVKGGNIYNEYNQIIKIYLFKHKLNNEYYQRILLFEDKNNHIKGLGFNIKNNLECVGREENDKLRKIYWIDKENILRFIKIEPDKDSLGNYKNDTLETSYLNIKNQNISNFDIIGDYDVSKTFIDFKGYGTGNLLIGKVQYATRFVNKNGNTTLYNINSQLIPIVSKFGNTNLELEGGDINENSNKSIIINIQDKKNSLKYDYLEIIGIYYHDNNTPFVKLIKRYECNKIINGITLEDDGNNYLDELTIEEITSISGLYIPQTLEIKNNRLFIANIKEKIFDVDYDMRAYSFTNIGTNENPIASSKVYNEDYSEEFEIKYDIYGIKEVPPNNFDCVNPYNDLLLEKNNNSKFKKYNKQINLNVFGGSGKYLNYSINTVSHYIDADKNNIQNIVGLPINEDSFFYLGINRGLQRDEIYRIGIVFFNKKGQSSFVKHIADIRTPNIDEIPLYTIKGNKIKVNNLVLGIEFVNMLPRDENGNFLQYQLVYAKRNLNNRTILTSGYLTDLYKTNFNKDTTNNLLTLFSRYLTGWDSNYYMETSHICKNDFEYTSPDIDINELDLSDSYLYLTNSYLNNSSNKNIKRINGYDEYITIFTKYINNNNVFNFSNKYYKLRKSLVLQTQDEYKPGQGSIFKINIDANKLGYYSPIKYSFDNKLIVPLTAMISEKYIFFEDDTFCPLIATYNNILFRSANSQYMNMIRPFILSLEENINIGVEYIKEGRIEPFPPTNFNVYQSRAIYGYLKKIKKPYNGYSNNSKSLSEYIPMSDIFSPEMDMDYIWKGGIYADTYIGFYNRMRQGITRIYADRKTAGKEYTWGNILDIENTGWVGNTDENKYAQSQGYSAFNSYIIETSIILPLMHGFDWNKHAGDINITYVTDQNNIKTIIGDSLINKSETEDYKSPKIAVLSYPDMFQYNGVYSKISDIKLYFPKPQIYDKYNHFSTQIKYSEVKYDGEIYDSFLIFKPNNSYNVSEKYGQIKQLLYWKNFLFNFQERGMCILPINEKTAITGNLGSVVIIGEGDLIGSELNYAQGSDKFGLQNNNKAIATPSGIYWIDLYNKVMIVYSGQINEINIIKGLYAWMKENVDENTYYISGYDPIYKEILFSFHNQDNNKFNDTLVYNELLQTYQGIYNFKTDRYINNPELISCSKINRIDNDNIYYLWLHNKGLRANWYGKQINDVSYIELIINDETKLPKEFNNIQYMSESFSINDNIDNLYDTLNIIKSSNDFLESEEINLKVFRNGDTLYVGGLQIPETAPTTVKNIRRRERMWHTTIPRMLSNGLIDNYRMRDSYNKLKLQYNNSNNNIFRLHEITTFYSFAYNNE